jgi:hypothetical protein
MACWLRPGRMGRARASVSNGTHWLRPWRARRPCGRVERTNPTKCRSSEWTDDHRMWRDASTASHPLRRGVWGAPHCVGQCKCDASHHMRRDGISVQPPWRPVECDARDDCGGARPWSSQSATKVLRAPSRAARRVRRVPLHAAFPHQFATSLVAGRVGRVQRYTCLRSQCDASVAAGRMARVQSHAARRVGERTPITRKLWFPMLDARPSAT